jgi:hypothetical protein
MEFAKEKVGGAAVETGVRLMATIGLRLLDERTQERSWHRAGTCSRPLGSR